MADRKLTVALFDLDGVVFDTEEQYTVFWGAQCKLYHPDKPGLEHIIKGQTLVQIYDKYFSEMKEEQEVITKRLDEFEKTMSFDYVPGFLDYMADLKAHDVRTAVVTSSNKAKMNAVYETRPEFKSLFDAILTSEDFAKSKPDPDCYLKGAARFGAPCEECVVFEDSFNGLKSGRGAGMKVIGLATTNSEEAISPYSDYVIKDFKELCFKKTIDIMSNIV